MTLTESAPTDAPAKAPTPTPSGLAGVLGSGDHKVIGRLWIGASLAFLVLSGMAGAVVSIERLDTAAIDVAGEGWFAQVFTLHAVAGAFLFLLPLTIGLATLVVPLQVGAATIAFGRASAGAFWTFLLAGGLVVAAYAIDGGPFGANLDAVGLFIAALALAIAAQILAWITIVTTVIALRAPGMTLARTPLFSWSALVAGSVWLLTLPVLVGMLVLSYLDVHYGGAGGVFLGGAEGVYGRIAWVFGQPAVYAFAIPVLGFAGDAVPVFSATRHLRHRLAMGCIGAYGVLSIGAWALPGIGPAGGGAPWLHQVPWAAVSLAIILPVVVLARLWVGTLRRGAVRVASPLLYALGAVGVLALGLLAAAVQAPEGNIVAAPADEPGYVTLYGTTWTTGVGHLVLLSATIALLGAIAYWASKILGRSLAEGLQRLTAALAALGAVALSLPDLLSGLLGQRPGQRYVAAENIATIEALNAVSAAGAALLGLAVVAFLLGMIQALASRSKPSDDPWGGHTLEWATASPPPVGNFASLPEVRSEAPLYDARHRQEADA